MMAELIVGHALIGMEHDMLKQYSRFLCLVLMVLLTHCRFLTTPPSVQIEPPPGPPEFQQGYKDGCTSGIAAYGSQYYKLFHRPT
jgi:hypothetical protein